MPGIGALHRRAAVKMMNREVPHGLRSVVGICCTAYVAVGPEASFSCVAAIRPESGVKPTCRDRSTDAIDPTATSAKRQKLLVKQLTALPKVLL
jgi:hypothetical protein